MLTLPPSSLSVPFVMHAFKSGDLALRKAEDSDGREVTTYYDGPGPLWFFQECQGVPFIVQAQTFEDAHGIWEDEHAEEAPAIAELLADFPGKDSIESLMDDACFQESYGFRPNGRNASDVHGHGIYQKDLNGMLGMELREQNAITVFAET